MSKYVYMPLLLAAAISLPACKDLDTVDIDYCLDPSYKVPLEVTVNVNDSFRKHLDTDTVFEKVRSDDTDAPYLKYFVAAYPTAPNLPVEIASSLSPVVKINLHPANYRMIGWVAYEEAEENTSRSRGTNFYTDDFEELLLRNKYSYSGAHPFKLAYRAAHDRNIGYTTKSTEIEATPAMGYFRLEATDEPMFNPCKVVVYYTSLLPAAINGKTGELNWWWDDIHFNSVPEDTLLAHDYVLSQDSETKVTATVEVYDENNVLRARKKNLEIPLKNGGITTIRGNFYSVLELDGAENAGSGINIKTEWDATFDIQF